MDERRDEPGDLVLCDRCGAPVPAGGRYRLVVSLQQAAETLVVKSEDLRRDLANEIERTIDELMRLDPRQVEAEVAAFFAADLCRACRDLLYQRLTRATKQ